jgi:hypothetical protein
MFLRPARRETKTPAARAAGVLKLSTDQSQTLTVRR